MEYDLVIRDGTIADGSGDYLFKGDVAVSDGIIAAVGRVDGRGREEIDATGCIVTPGFVDIHTHYDGQAHWEHTLAPSSQHGVTTVIAGNCGIGFAPCRQQDRDTLVRFMEGVEDIPEAVMEEGLPWNWESFPDYLDALAQRELDIDIGAMVPHSPLRVFVMGQRGVDREEATEADCAQMTRIVADAVRAGAIGVSTSRAMVHCAKDGAPAPSIGSATPELLALAQGLKDADNGVFQLITEATSPPEVEFGVMLDIARRAGRPLSFTLAQSHSAPDRWRDVLRMMREANEDGIRIKGQYFPRPVGTLLGLDLSFNPFSRRPSWKAIAHLSQKEKLVHFRDTDFRERILAEEDVPDNLPLMNMVLDRRSKLFALGNPPDYAPPASRAAGAVAAARGIDIDALLYEWLLEQDGHAILYLPISNFADSTLDAARAMMDDPNTVLGLGDGGAHYGLICDASFPTTMLAYWARDVAAEQRIELPRAVRMLSQEPARTVGLDDRGEIKVGLLADLNVIDFDRLSLGRPEVRFDLPGGGRRLIQQAAGYDAIVKRGQITYRHGVATGALPGRLVRGGQARALVH